MKTTLILLFVLCSLDAWCCDNCNVFMNITPNDNKHYIGLVYRQRLMMGEYSAFGQQMMTKHAGHGNDPALWGNTVSEHFNTFELQGRFQIGNRWRTYVIVPFVHNVQSIDENVRYRLSGIGDPILIESFQLIDPTKTYKNESFGQRLELGLGFKAPLGKTDQLVNEERPNLDLQSGTGSWDGIGFLRYIMKIKSFGTIGEFNYKFNGRNNEGYKYGNTINGSLKLFYQTKVNRFTLMPLVGAYVEQASFDQSVIEHSDTGGRAIFANMGLQLFYKNFQLFGEFRKAVSNKMNGYKQLINKYQINTGLIYNFK